MAASGAAVSYGQWRDDRGVDRLCFSRSGARRGVADRRHGPASDHAELSRHPEPLLRQPVRGQPRRDSLARGDADQLGHSLADA